MKKVSLLQQHQRKPQDDQEEYDDPSHGGEAARLERTALALATAVNSVGASFMADTAQDGRPRAEAIMMTNGII